MEARPARATRKTPLLPVVLTGVQFLDDLAGIRQGQRPGEEVPLRELAAQRLKGRELLLVLHALGHRRQVHVLGHGHDGAHQFRAAAVFQHTQHEGTVDFQGVEGLVVQVTQGRVPGAEVVQVQFHAQRLHLLQGLEDGLRLPQQHALGDFDVQPRRVKTRFVQHILKEIHRARRTEMLGTEVDAQGQ